VNQRNAVFSFRLSVFSGRKLDDQGRGQVGRGVIRGEFRVVGGDVIEVAFQKEIIAECRLNGAVQRMIRRHFDAAGAVARELEWL
jgi:hypothetical protein